MRCYLFCIAILPIVINAFPRQEKLQSNLPGLKPLLFIIERVLDNQVTSQRQNQRSLEPKQPLQKQRKQNDQNYQSVDSNTANTQNREEKPEVPVIVSAREQSLIPNLQYVALPFYEPQFQYPDYNFLHEKQPRIQPQIYLYGASGQGQPILINPGNPPGNFLVPQQPQPGPNFVLRNNPNNQRPPVFVAGYPKPAHIPPIEKDAEEVPTNPAKIPPLANSGPTVRKPEKLETFNEGRTDYSTKSAGEADVLGAADKNPQLIPTNLKPGQRFFILNGEPLFQDYHFQNYPEPQTFGQSFQPETFQKQQQDVNVQTFLAEDGHDRNIDFFPINQQALFRSELPLNVGQEKDYPIGQFKYPTPNFQTPNNQFFTLGSEDIENDSIVVDAKVEDNRSDGNSDNNTEVISDKSVEPSTAQAAPGAIALAGPGGVAGAAPRGTALVGKGGLAVSSPQATAIAGTKDEEKKPKRKNKNK